MEHIREQWRRLEGERKKWRFRSKGRRTAESDGPVCVYKDIDKLFSVDRYQQNNMYGSCLSRIVAVRSRQLEFVGVEVPSKSSIYR